MGLVSDAWAGFGSAFGPVVLLALFWKRSTLAGAISGMATGALTVIVWDYLPLVNGVTLYKATNLYSLVLGFALITNSLPLLSSDDTLMYPPCFSIIVFASESPIPTLSSLEFLPL